MTALLARVSNLVRGLNNSTPVPYVGRQPNVSLFGQGGGQDVHGQMRLYGSVGTLFAIVSMEATAVAKVNWHLYRKAASGKVEDRVEVTEHPALSVLNRPNNFMTRQELFESGQQHTDLTGMAYWVIARIGDPKTGTPLELWPVRPDRMTAVTDPQEFLIGWLYKGPSGELVPLERENVLQNRMPDPETPYYGLAPVAAVKTDAEAATLIAEWNRNFFRNSAIPSGTLSFKEMLGDLDFQTVVTRWREQHQGVSNAHRVAVLEGGAVYAPMGYSQKDMEFSTLRQVSADVILEAFAFPKFMLGQVEDVNRASAQASKNFFAEYHTVTRLDRWKGLLNNDLLSQFGTLSKGYEFDYDSPVSADEEIDNQSRDSKVAAFVALTGAGLNPVDVLKYLGLPDMAARTVAEPAGQTDVEKALDLANMIQKIYLGVDTVVTYKEARTMLAQAGAPVDPNAEQPEKPAPANPFGGEPADPNADPAAPAPEPGNLANRAVAELVGLAVGRAFAAAGMHADHGDDPPGSRRGRPVAVTLAADNGSRIDLTGVQADWLDQLDDVIRAWGDVTAAQRREIERQVTAAVDSNDVSALSSIEVSSSQGAAILAVAMSAISARGAKSAVKEASDQGVDTHPGHPDESLFTAVAALTASLLAAGLANAAGREALRWYSRTARGADVAKAVDEHLAGLSDAYLRDNLGGALSRAQMSGRLATYAIAPEASLYSSEVLDSAICKRCREVTGKFLGLSTDQAQVLLTYPNGQYVHCLGGVRCRGQVVAVWRPETTGEDS